MKTKFFLSFLITFCLNINLFSQNQLPIVTILGFSYQNYEILTQIEYIIEDGDSDIFDVSLWTSNDSGITFTKYDPNLLSGDIGLVNNPGIKTITGIDFPASSDFNVAKIVVDDMYQVNIQEVVNKVDENRLKNYLTEVEGVRNYQVGAEKLEQTRNLIIEHLISEGKDTLTQNFKYLNIWNGKNIIGIQNGTEFHNSVYMVGGHYDSVAEGPGADDNGTAVAAMMEIASVFNEYNFKNSIEYVAWDFEEQGLIGSSYFANNLTSSKTINAYLNFEMIGYYSEKDFSQTLPVGFDFLFPAAYNQILANDFKGDFLTNVGNATNSLALMNDFQNIASIYVPDLKIISIASPGNGSNVPDLLRSDHAPFWFKNIPAVMLTDGANFRNKNYHTALDVMDSLDFEFFANNTKAAIAYLAEKAEINHSGYAIERIPIPVSEKPLQLYSQFSISPNPTKSFIQIQIPGNLPNKTINWEINGSDGKQFLKGKINPSKEKFEIDIQQLPNGTYFMSMYFENEVVSKSFVKM